LKSESLSQRLKKTDEGEFALSLYEDGFPSKKDFETASNRLSIAFPKMKGEFFILLTEFVVKEKFTAKRLSDAVNHVIANFQYKELNISDIIRFDKRVKLYTRNEVYQVAGQFPIPDFEQIEVDGKRFWYKIADMANNQRKI